MKDFAGKIAVITGGGTGTGRELARQLTAEGCSVALCDISLEAMAETKRLALADAPQGTQIHTHQADVSLEAQIQGWAAKVQTDLQTDKIHLLFNNAGIAGGGSMITSPRGDWERTFNVCWGGVYYCTRAFLPMLMKAPEGHIVNTSSINGFWASVGPGRPHTAYSAAKFAVKGFSEALMNDLAVNAPHIKCSVVMPGHIGTEIVANTMKLNNSNPGDARSLLKARGLDTSAFTDEQVAELMGAGFRDSAPMSAAEAARVILDGVKAGTWRILVGKDAEYLDKAVRANPEEVYSQGFFDHLTAQQGWRI